ncbi:type I polyketide synthase, partial [Streptomyces lasiicapitis]|uniref:type I polyketide synthase n=1 Tax=Streptomyces lasiicapitis TaxID=1923961 RepID=UPI0036B3F054
GQGRSEDQPLLLGALKSNIGHTQAAAGVAGVIKRVMAIRAGVLPKTLHVDSPTSEVDWSAGTVELLTQARDWPEREPGLPRRAGVSSFGMSGTNAHVIVEQAPVVEEPAADETEGAAAPSVVAGVVPLALSAKSGDALRAQAGQVRELMLAGAGLELGDLAWSLAASRSRFEQRGVVLGRGRDELLAGLERLAEGEGASGGVVTGRALGGTVRPVFVFPGQGSQWAGMARELLDDSPVFAERMRECAEALSAFVDWELLEELNGERFDRVDVVQPVLFAVMVSLAAVWQAAGVKPAAVVGHSQGEIAAACVAGVLSLEDAARVVALRSLAIRELSGKGGMVSVPLPEDQVRELIAAWDGRIELAAVNGPAQVVVSGEPEALEELVAQCVDQDIRARTIPVDYASHSSYVEQIETEMAQALSAVSPQAAEVPLYSTLTGAWLDANTPMDAGYWYRNLRQTVLFEHATRGLLAEGHGLFLEMSPHPVLTVPVQATIDATATPAATLGSLRRDEGGAHRLATSLAEAHVHGAELDWNALHPGSRTRVDLPTYPFQHQHYWLHATPTAGDVTAAGLGDTGHPLLGAAVPLADGDGHLLTGRLSLRTHPWLADHAVAGAVLLPATAFVELASRAGDQVDCDLVEELTMEMPLVVPETGGVQLQLTVGPADASGRRTLAFHSRPEAGPDAGGAEAEPWTRHATGVMASAAAPTADSAAAFDLAQWPPRDAQAVGIDGLYEEFAAADVQYGPAFQGLRSVWRRGDEVFAEVGIPEERRDEAGRFGLHPVLLDAALQAAHLAQDDSDDGDEGGAPRLPFSWSDVSLYATGAKSLRVRLTRSGTGGDTVSVLLADDAGAPVARIGSLVSRTVDVRQSLAARSTRVPNLYRVNWVEPPAVAPARAERAATWAVLGADGTDARELCRLLGEDGDGLDVASYPTLADLTAAVAEGTAPVPDVVVAADGTRADDGPAGTADAAYVANTADAAHTPVSADAAHRPVSADAVHTAAHAALTLVQTWLAAGDRFADARLIVLTRGAAAVTPDEPLPGVAHAAVLGLLRSSPSDEHGRLVLADMDSEHE